MKISVIKNGHCDKLTIELTRKCNFSCSHCLRGNAESKDFDINHFNKFIYDNNIESISTITLTGGEPLLVPDIISEIAEVIIQRNIDVNNYYIATNGSQFNIDSMRALTKLHSACSDNDTSWIEVSNSIWHEEDKNFIPYMDLNDICMYLENDGIWELPRADVLDDIRISQRSFLSWSNNILDEGRAKGSGSTNLEAIEKLTYINVNGDIVLDYCDCSYETQEKIKEIA